MKLTTQRSSRVYIGTEWERNSNIWEILLEDTDFDSAIRNRFQRVQVEQYQYAGDGTDPESGKISTTFKATRTNWFDRDTKDKQKLLVIDAVTNFIQNNTHALVAQWSEQSAHN